MSDPKPLIYPFENPSITVGLAAINATDPPYKVESHHLTSWFKEGIIAHYVLLNDLREMWGREALRAEFEEVFGEVKHCTLLAYKVSDKEWDTVEDVELATYGTYALDTAAALYGDEQIDIPSITHEGIGQEKQNTERGKAVFNYPMPEPVLPRYEAEKIYSMIHGKPVSEKEPKKHETALQSKVIVDGLVKEGFTEQDFKGSIKQLQRKITNKGLNGTLTSVTEKTLIKWLKQALVR